MRARKWTDAEVIEMRAMRLNGATYADVPGVVTAEQSSKASVANGTRKRVLPLSGPVPSKPKGMTKAQILWAIGVKTNSRASKSDRKQADLISLFVRERAA